MTSGEMHARFCKYDRNRSGGIEIDEFKSLAIDLGLLKHRNPSEVDAFLVQQFAGADVDRDNKLSPHEFEDYYRKVTAPKLSEALATENVAQMKALKRVFHSFAAFGNRGLPADDLGSAHWMKLCRDTGVLASGVTQVEADLAFMKVKHKGSQKITFDEFVDALSILSTKTQGNLDDLVHLIITAEGPVINGTVVSAERYYDYEAPLDRNPTNTHSRATTSHHSGSRAHSAATITSTVSSSSQRSGSVTAGSRSVPSAPSISDGGGDRTPVSKLTDAFGDRLSIGGTTSTTTGGSAGYGSGGRRGGKDKDQVESGREVDEAVFPTFCAFATQGTGSTALPTNPDKILMDSRQFMKMCKDSGLLGGKLNPSAVDLSFTKAKTKGARKLTFSQFCHALTLLAQEKSCTEDEIKGTIISCAGPISHHSVDPMYVRLHDDKSTFTGVYARGGPVISEGHAGDAARLVARYKV